MTYPTYVLFCADSLDEREDIKLLALETREQAQEFIELVEVCLYAQAWVIEPEIGSSRLEALRDLAEMDPKV